MSPLVFVGIDVSQPRLDIAIRPGSSFSIVHDESAITTLVGTRHLDEQTDRGPRRRRALESRQWHAVGRTHGLRRTGPGACGPLLWVPSSRPASIR